MTHSNATSNNKRHRQPKDWATEDCKVFSTQQRQDTNGHSTQQIENTQLPPSVTRTHTHTQIRHIQPRKCLYLLRVASLWLKLIFTAGTGAEGRGRAVLIHHLLHQQARPVPQVVVASKVLKNQFTITYTLMETPQLMVPWHAIQYVLKTELNTRHLIDIPHR